MADGDRGFSYRLRHQLRQQRFLLSIVIFAAGILLTVFAIADFTPLGTVGPFPAIVSATDQSPSGGTNYNLALAFIGPIVALIGAYLVGAYYIARRKFDHLMETKSKAEFLRNLPEIEDLLWDLTPVDEVRYEEKKGELRIRR